MISPAEIDCKEDGDVALQSKTGDPKDANRSWGDFLARDVKLLADTGIEGIVFLPNWEKSKGAKLEAFVGLLQKNFKFFLYKNGSATPYAAYWVAFAIHHEMLMQYSLANSVDAIL